MTVTSKPPPVLSSKLASSDLGPCSLRSGSLLAVHRVLQVEQPPFSPAVPPTLLTHFGKSVRFAEAGVGVSNPSSFAVPSNNVRSSNESKGYKMTSDLMDVAR